MTAPGHRWARGPAKRRETAARDRCWLCEKALVCTLAVLFYGSPAAGQLANEQAIRTAFVFNLTKYVEWPQAKTEIVIGFLGEGGMGESLRTVLSGKISDSRPIRVLVNPADEELGQCDLVYLAPASVKEFRADLSRLRNRGVLTVGDAEWFAHEGGMVGMVRQGEQIHLQINLQATQAAELKISSRVLSLAEIVAGKTGAGK